MTPAQAEGLTRYIRFYETLTLDSLKGLGDLLTPDATFRDPFNDVRGVEKIRHVFEDMFKTIGAPDFKVTDTAAGANDTVYMRWVFIYRVGGKGAPVTVDGMSAVTLAPDGRVSAHVDYWDAAQGLYEHVPVIGWVLRRIRGRIAV